MVMLLSMVFVFNGLTIVFRVRGEVFLPGRDVKVGIIWRKGEGFRSFCYFRGVTRIDWKWIRD